jgi:glycerol-3-phosphate dehydrogenase
MTAVDKRAASVEKAILSKGIQGVECTPWRGSIRLSGEVADYGQAVCAGRAAAGFGYKGVVNDIGVKGFSEPAVSAPEARDGSLDNLRPDVLVIGGGVIGCAIARELARYALSVVLLEKESDVAMHASSRNDGMIHPGIASKPGTLRAEYNVRGNALYTQLTRELDVPFERIGNLILSQSRALLLPMGVLFRSRMGKLDIEGRKLDKREVYTVEPNLRGHIAGGFLFPSSGILSPYLLTVALAENAVENGVRLRLNTMVESMEIKSGEVAGVVTNRGTLRPRVVVNAAGAFADKVADMAGDRFFSIHPRKGELVILDRKKGGRVHTSLSVIGLSQYQSDTKGGGVMPTIDGNVLVGPDAYDQPFREDFSTHAAHVSAILEKHLPLIRGLTPQDVITYFAGIRAATYEEEFIVEKSEYVGNLVHAAGIQSPGLASAPAIAEDIARVVVEALSQDRPVEPNPRFDPVRKHRSRFSRLTMEEKQEAIRQNPDYGVIVCRCEGISRGEVIDAIKSPVPALTLDAVKRRARPGMGRCQGAFCSPHVAELIARYAGIDAAEVTKSGGESRVLLASTPKGEAEP